MKDKRCTVEANPLYKKLKKYVKKNPTVKVIELQNMFGLSQNRAGYWKQRALGNPTPKKPVQPGHKLTRRKCNMCHKPFMSSWIGNRRCPACSKLVDRVAAPHVYSVWV